MAKISKEEAARHEEAEKLLEKDVLTISEREYVLEHWHEGARHLNSVAGAFFTPLELARDFAVEVTGRRIIDLCAGIGRLSYLIKAAASPTMPCKSTAGSSSRPPVRSASPTSKSEAKKGAHGPFPARTAGLSERT
jgi:hypothetical protein